MLERNSLNLCNLRTLRIISFSGSGLKGPLQCGACSKAAPPSSWILAPGSYFDLAYNVLYPSLIGTNIDRWPCYPISVTR
jgi:predicted small lipoprotein YifL